MLQQDMTAALRQDFGKGAARQLRLNGHTPAVLYGGKMDPIALTMETKSLTKDLLRLHGNNVVITLEIEGEDTKKIHYVLIKDIQTDPVADSVLHVDFLEIELEKEIVMEVPVEYTGTPKGVDLGGILNIVAHTVKIKGLPLNIPDGISIDITELELGGAGITCADLAIPADVTLEEDPSNVCVSVIAPKAVEEEAEEAEEIEEGEEGAEEASSEEEPAASTEE